jgi:diacylglycerol kinase (ATP)
MRAAAIFGPRTTPNHLARFQRADLGVAITRAQSPPPDVDAVLVFGGDGTVHRHLARLVETKVPLLVVPGGSGNDFARSLGLKSRAEAFAAWEGFCRGERTPREIDLGFITPITPADASDPAAVENSGFFPGKRKSAARRSTYFCCIGGAGLDSETNRRANRMPAWVRAHGGYIIAALREMGTWKAMEMSVKVLRPSGHWEDRIAEPATFVVFANAPSYGDGMRIAPQATLNDGLLDVCFVRRTSKRRIFTFFPTVFVGAHLRLPEVEYFQTAALRFQTERPLDVYADGEYVCKTPIEVSIRPRALSVIV